MGRPILRLNSVDYPLEPFEDGRHVREVRPEGYAVAFRQGPQAPEHLAPYQSLIYPSFMDGLGRDRTDSDSALVTAEYRRFWDATLDTRFASGAYLPIQEEDSTSTGLEVIRASAAFKGNLWAIWEDDAGRSIKSRKYVGSSTTWTAGGTLFTSPVVDATSAQSTGGATTLTISHAVDGDDPNMALIVAVGSVGAAPSGITYAGVAMTKLSENANGTRYVSLWYLAAPARTTNNIIVTLASSNIIIAGGVSFAYVNQASVLSNFASADHGSGGEKSSNVTTTVCDVVVDVMIQGGTADMSDGDDQTQLFELDGGSSRAEASYQRADDTSTTMVWTLAGGISEAAWAGAKVNGAIAVPLDIIAHKNNLLALAAGHQSHSIHRSTDGATWTAPTTPITGDLLSTTITQSVDSDLGLLSQVGGEAVAALYHEDNSVITFFSSADGGAVWVDESASTDIDISSTNGPQGLAVMAGIDNEDKLYVGTREGLHEVDTATAVWTTRLIFPMVSSNDNCRRMKVMDDGALWFAQGVDNDTPPIVYRMFVSNGARQIERVPNDFSRGDGTAPAALGPIRWMESAGGMVYVSAGGATGTAAPTARSARIWAHNGRGWHSMREHGTVNRKIQWITASADDDGTPRLHYAIRSTNTVGVYTTTTHFLGQPFVNPASGVAINREESGYIDLPWVDFGHPHENKNVLRVGINAKGLYSTTGRELINVDYGSVSDMGDLTARGSFTDLGNFFSGISRIALASGVGLSSRAFALRVNLLRRTSGTYKTNSPVVKDVSIDGYAVLPDTEQLEFRVNLKEAAALNARHNITPITSLKAARASVPLVPLTYADLGTVNVRVTQVEFAEEITTAEPMPGAANSNDRRTGFALVRVSQPIA